MLQESPAQLFALFWALVAPHSEQKSPMPIQSPLWPFVTGAFARRILLGGDHSSLALFFSRRPLHCSFLHKQHVPLPSRSIDRSDESAMNLLGEPRSKGLFTGVRGREFCEVGLPLYSVLRSSHSSGPTRMSATGCVT